MTVLLPHLETMTWFPTSGPTYGSRCSKNANFLHFFLRSSSRVQPDLRPLCLLWRLHFGHILLLLTGVDHFHYCQYYFPKKKKTNLAPLLLIPTYCSPCKALWPGHKAPQDLTHCNFLFMPLLTCCPVPSRRQHSSSPICIRQYFSRVYTYLSFATGFPLSSMNRFLSDLRTPL